MFSCSEKFAGSASSGSTCSSTKARVRTRRSSISGESVKSMHFPLNPAMHDLAAVDHDGRAGHVAAGIGRQQQQRAVEIAAWPNRPTGMSRVMRLYRPRSSDSRG